MQACDLILNTNFHMRADGVDRLLSRHRRFRD